jgi:hypothetical protein
LQFLAPSVLDSDPEQYAAIIQDAFTRVKTPNLRISYFEEIIALFVALTHPGIRRPASFDELEVVDTLKARLSRVQRRDQQTNEFENWIYGQIQEKLHARGY